MTLLRTALQSLSPPVDATPEALAMWRMGVFMALLGLAAVLSTHISMTSGLFGEEKAFASQSDLAEIKVDMAGITRRSIEIDILNLRVRQCEALAASNQDAARFAGETLQARRLEYAQVTSRPYPLPSCREVGVDT